MTRVTLNKFYGGVDTNKREPSTTTVYSIKNFDFLNSNELLPYNSLVSETASNSYSTSYNVRAFSQGNGNLYGLGTVDSDSTISAVHKRALSSISGGAWTLNFAINNSAGVLARGGILGTLDFFHFYRGFLYFVDTVGIKKVQITGSPAVTTNQALTTVNSACNGVTHSKDNKLYFGYNDTTSPNSIPYIASYDNSTWNTTALTMPDSYKITSICEYNNYLAIGLAPKDINGKSVVYIWDRSSTLNTITESIDWGYGELRVLECIEGRLIGISVQADSSTRINPKIIFREYSGGVANVILKVDSDTTSINLGTSKQKIDNKLYFTMSTVLNGVTNTGVWVFSRYDNNYPWAVGLAQTPNNDSAITDTIGMPENFYLVGDYFFTSYDYNGSNSTSVSRTSSTSTDYSQTAVVETLKNPGMPTNDRALPKKLLAIAASYTSQPTAGQIVMKYKVDDGSWITVYTDTANGSTGFETTVDASGDAFTDGREYEFRLESTGGTVVGEISYRYEVLTSNING